MTNFRPKELPVLLSDAAAELFIETADLSGFKPMRFDFAQKDGRANVRREEETIHPRSGSDRA